ncbi:ferredoxin [Candidatus Uhrbacteria bacterium]|nr:ferredoxin [Candidatus Uhrbacteria bacterium]
MKVSVDREVCIGAASCVVLAAKTFRLDADGKAEVISMDQDTREMIIEAARSCPTNAIRVSEDDGTPIV